LGLVGAIHNLLARYVPLGGPYDCLICMLLICPSGWAIRLSYLYATNMSHRVGHTIVMRNKNVPPCGTVEWIGLIIRFISIQWRVHLSMTLLCNLATASLFVRLMLNCTSALFRLLVPRIVEIENIRQLVILCNANISRRPSLAMMTTMIILCTVSSSRTRPTSVCHKVRSAASRRSESSSLKARTTRPEVIQHRRRHNPSTSPSIVIN